MPSRVAQACRTAGCMNVSRKHHGYCDKCGCGWQKYQKEFGSSKDRGYGYIWQKRIRPSILKRDKYLCQMCLSKGKYIPAKIVDHIIPKKHGGTDDPSNLQSLCETCHNTKTAMEYRK